MKNQLLHSDQKFLVFLFFYHIAFSFLFTWYLGEYGGDAISFWELRAEKVDHPERWFSHWGTRSYFMQWLTYWPAYVFGLPLWSGNLFFSVLSYYGYYLLYGLVREQVDTQKHHWIQLSLWVVFLMPNLHFWSSSVGKQSISFLGIVLFLRGLHVMRPAWGYLIFGLGISYLVRPMQGFILMGGFIGLLIFTPSISNKFKAIFLLVAGLLAYGMLDFILYITHIPFLHPQKIMEFSASQMEFLEGFAAQSAVPMNSYSWPMRLWTLFFRPFMGEWESLWYVAASTENVLSLFLIIGAIGLMGRSGWKTVPLFTWGGILFGLLLMGVYALTLNNLGIIMRMKSFFMIFFHLLFVFGLAFAFSKKRENKNDE
ncbi:hypothetical protein [Cecembia calidifontis]|uniref:Glycosyltransferase RgtA/B/C/D-like domain-containing protein n=1 Tax=Cecembia calidifontis TaxID=1187080 RepID=A0A4Q7PD41_9BACT|nr:hypothetical protein [Cecembia calidifontis]RZS98276.1 hypothetical protein BC751_3918 [Cecembia calidifontis]